MADKDTGIPTAQEIDKLRKLKAQQDQEKKDEMTRKLEEKAGAPKPYAKGGKVRGGGCETKGKTKGKFV
jgi:hypothetical protein